MRPYFVLCAAVLMAVSAFAQAPAQRGYASYYYGPVVPMVTTPMVSLETVSPNPVGASNATTGLVAGATNATLSEIVGSTSSDYTVAVWYQGGAPLTTPEVSIWPEPAMREMHAMRHPMMDEAGMYERGGRKEAGKEKQWLYFTGSEHTADVVAASKGPRQAGRKYSNDDVTRQNDNNGKVHYDGKTEKIQ